MKEGWTYKKLGEVARVQNGFAFDSKYFNENGKGTPLIRIRDIKRSFSLTHTTETCSDDYVIENGHILIGMDGDFNVCFWAGGHAYLNQRVCRVVPSSAILPKFIYYLLPFPLKRINDKTSFSTVKHLSSKQVNNIIIPTPPIDEQRSIVARLDAAFAGIDALKANAERQFDEAVIFYRNALSEAMTPPKGWSRKLLKEIATIRIGPFGSLIHKKDHVPGCIPLVNPIHMKDGKIQREVYFTISEEKAEELSAYKLKTGDIVVARRGEIGRCAIVTNEEDGFICGTGSMIVRFNNPQRINSRFMLRLFQSPAVREYLVENAVGATMQNINAEIVSNLPITFPSYDEQTRIVTYLDKLATTIDDFGEIQRKTLAECDALKQAMLKEVFE